MKTRIFTLFALIAWVAFPPLSFGAETQTPAQAVKLEKYSNSEKGYSIEYPSTWKKTDVPQLDIALFAPSIGEANSPRASLNIVSDNVGVIVPLNTFYNESVNNLKESLKEVKIENSGTATINGVESKWVIYTHVMQNVKFRVLQYFIASDKSVYLITFGAVDQDFDHYKAEFEEIVKTFTIAKS